MDFDFEKIPQNSRTIIFEKFNDKEGMPNLCTLLKGRTSEEAVEVVNEKLLVHSFSEFKEKFEPTVYERINVNADGNLQSISYSLNSDDGGNPVSLCNHEFYKAVHDIIETKSNSGKSNEDSRYNKLYDALNPENIYNRARRQRVEAKEFLFNAMKEKENKNPSGVKKWLRLAQETFNDVKSEYSGSALRLLPLAITDMQQVVNSRTGGKAPKAIETGAENTEALPLYTLKWDGNGALKPVKEKETAVVALEMKEDSNTKLVTAQWEKIADSIPEGNVDKNLFMSIYSEQKNMALQTVPTDELKQRIDVMAKMYDHAQQSFFDAIGYLVQKVAGIEQFFRHAGDENGEVKAGVIIANCNIDDVLYSDESENAVKNFFKRVNTSENERIWFAVLPSASVENNDWKPESVDNEMPDIENMDLFSMDEETDDEKRSDVPVYSVGEINRVTNLLKDCGILSFFNFCPCEKTGFTQFEEKTFEQYTKESKAIDSKDSVVLAFPNFTVIPKNKSGFESVSGDTLYVPTVYIDAAYIAAGITVATQTSKIQQKKNSSNSIIKNNPFVHFDLEKKENSRKFFANFNPECRLNMSSELQNFVLGDKMGGFCFQSDTLVKQAFILSARTLDNRPLYQYITKNYLDFMVEREQIKLESEAKSFEKGIKNMQNQSGNDEKVNPILMSDEIFEFSKEEESFSLRFKGREEPMILKTKIKENV